MTEKVIHEVRFIETDDGFRIEVKGDKERIRKMGFGPGMGFGSGMMGFGPGRCGKHRRRRGRHGHHKRHHVHGSPASSWGWWWDDDDENIVDEKPPKDA